MCSGNRRGFTETRTITDIMTSFPGRQNKTPWLDEEYNVINAHGGGILPFDGGYYWYGEHKTEGWEGRLAFLGVHAYYSADLIHWHDLGIVLKVTDDSGSPICRGCRIERPKVLHCPATGKFVMYFHSTDADHTLARRGLAVADTPEGPFRFLGAERANAGKWPANAPVCDASGIPPETEFSNGRDDKTRRYPIYARDVAGGQMCRDMNLFVDEDGTAYHIYSSEHNSTLHVARLTPDFLDWDGCWYRILPYGWNEGAALFKRNGWYFLLMSGCTGWNPNAARGAAAQNLAGPWLEFGNPARGDGAEMTFGTQSSAVFSIGDRYFAMLDCWNPKNFIDSRYLWLELQFPSAERFEMWNTPYFSFDPLDMK